MGRLLLWDIDHTLIESGRVGILVYAEAFAKVTGHPLGTMPELPGRTEPVIFREALRVNGVLERAGLYQRFAAAQAQGLDGHLDDLRRHGRANDVAAALDSGVRIIAVATGRETAADLAAAGASTVLPDLTDTSAVVAAILQGSLRRG